MRMRHAATACQHCTQIKLHMYAEAGLHLTGSVSSASHSMADSVPSGPPGRAGQPGRPAVGTRGKVRGRAGGWVSRGAVGNADGGAGEHSACRQAGGLCPLHPVLLSNLPPASCRKSLAVLNATLASLNQRSPEAWLSARSRPSGPPAASSAAVAAARAVGEGCCGSSGGEGGGERPPAGPPSSEGRGVPRPEGGL